MRHVVFLGGPNLDRLGEREPEKYGTTSWSELETMCETWAARAGCRVTFLQTNSEGELVEWIGHWSRQADSIVLNAAAYTHTSVAVRDAVAAAAAPVIELHLTNPDSREAFRRTNLLADVVAAGVRGFGIQGYRLALDGALALCASADESD